MGRVKAPWAFRKGRKNERHAGYRRRWYYQVIQGDMYVIHEGEYFLLMKSLLRKLGFGYMLSPMVAYTSRIIMQAIPARVITGNYNTGPSGPVILRNTTKFGTPTKISKMQASQNNNSTKSTPGSPLSIKIEEQENGETWVSITPPPQLAPPPPPPRMTTPRPPTPKTAQDGWETTVGLPTSPSYRAPDEWEEAERKEQARQEHDQLSWTA